MMATDSLIDSLPDLVLHLRRDGFVLARAGGSAVAGLAPTGACEGRSIAALWPEAVAQLVRRLTRKAIALRAMTTAEFRNAGQTYEARVTAQGPDRVLCVIRMLPGGTGGAPDLRSRSASPQRGGANFLERIHGSVALATLCERPLAVAVVEVDGVGEIARLADAHAAEQAVQGMIQRLESLPRGADAAGPPWFSGQLGERRLALVIEAADRAAVAAVVARVCSSLRDPITIGATTFHLTPYAGAAVLGEDSIDADALVDHARTAASEARRLGSNRARFFTDALTQCSLTRHDSARELCEAIDNGDIRLQYIGRHDLITGRVMTWVGYLRWTHPVRGEVRPAEFLAIAEATGLATTLSRAALRRVTEDLAAYGSRWDPDVRISFGALRHHLLEDGFVADLMRLAIERGAPPERLELRIAERTFVSMAARRYRELAELGVRLVVDEVARGMGSLDALARASIWGLQLDRAWVSALRTDEIARKVCRAGIAVAAALDLTPIATGVDDEAQRDALIALGCRHGSGDLYSASAADITRQAGARRFA